MKFLKDEVVVPFKASVWCHPGCV